jgi:hypothetical protein
MGGLETAGFFVRPMPTRPIAHLAAVIEIAHAIEFAFSFFT